MDLGRRPVEPVHFPVVPLEGKEYGGGASAQVEAGSFLRPPADPALRAEVFDEVMPVDGSSDSEPPDRGDGEELPPAGRPAEEEPTPPVEPGGPPDPPQPPERPVPAGGGADDGSGDFDFWASFDAAQRREAPSHGVEQFDAQPPPEITRPQQLELARDYLTETRGVLVDCSRFVERNGPSVTTEHIEDEKITRFKIFTHGDTEVTFLEARPDGSQARSDHVYHMSEGRLLRTNKPGERLAEDRPGVLSAAEERQLSAEQQTRQAETDRLARQLGTPVGEAEAALFFDRLRQSVPRTTTYAEITVRVKNQLSHGPVVELSDAVQAAQTARTYIEQSLADEGLPIEPGVEIHALGREDSGADPTLQTTHGINEAGNPFARIESRRPVSRAVALEFFAKGTGTLVHPDLPEALANNIPTVVVRWNFEVVHIAEVNIPKAGRIPAYRVPAHDELLCEVTRTLVCGKVSMEGESSIMPMTMDLPVGEQLRNFLEWPTRKRPRSTAAYRQERINRYG